MLTSAVADIQAKWDISAIRPHRTLLELQRDREDEVLRALCACKQRRLWRSGSILFAALGVRPRLKKDTLTRDPLC
ncbi:hypothetical protein BMW22_06800 [Rhizobium leguminosarum]|uniref:Uncharacterized protein n=1 Tax=Rhizobium leguminosarum TaxID=384 RepID=A0A154IIP1_RHILE|nr:hypothetical protein BMW22_06800 [Rhizobium leguminosarum]KZB00414.1 hypothetical protein A4A59_18630 [Rhizobium leguminosarum]